MSKFVSLEQVKTLANKVKSEDAALGTKIETVAAKVEGLISTGGEANILEGVKVNGTALSIADKMVDILIAAGTENGTLSVNGASVAITGLQSLAYKSEISEDDLDAALLASIAAKATKADLDALTVRVGNIESAGYQTAEQVQAAITAAKHARFEEAESVPTAEEAEENVMYLVMNEETGHYDIYALAGGNVVLLDDTTVDLSEYAKTADVTAAISAAITGLNIDQYATDDDLNAAIARIAAVEAKFDQYYTSATIDTMFANYYTSAQIDTKLDTKMDKAGMDAYATDEEAEAAASAAVEAAKASDEEFSAAMNEVWTPSEG